MKTFKLIMLIFLLLIFPAISHSQTLGDARISLIDGDVQIRTEDTGDWVPVSINMPLREGDRIWVPEGGKTELQLRDGTYLRFDEKSAFELLTLDRDSTQFYLNEGHAYVNFRGRKGTLLQIDTLLSSSRAYGSSIFGVEALGDGLNQISVFKGSVDAESKDGKTTIRSGYALTLKGETYAELSPLGPPDEWERWNRERDSRIAEWRPPSRYLPEELYAYSKDFDENGRWAYVAEYGYVWTPRVVVSVGWAPYRIGRWIWIAGDYVWISYEPWGWVPYHYGRWAFVASIGWCWVPPVRGAVFWGPGFVAWIRTPTYVAWVPLAPREIYYGHGHYGPHSVNITHVNVTNIHIDKVVYKNVHNAVTVVHRDTFVKGKHVDVKVKENPFLKEKISIGRPDIKPEKATTTPVVKEIPERKRPPEPIREIKVKELKEIRPLGRERNVSVLRPESPPKEMPLKVNPSAPRPEASGSLRVAPERGSSTPPSETGPGAVERVKEGKPVERQVEKLRASKPAQRSVEKSEVKRSTEKPREGKPQERGLEKPREIKLPEKGVEKPKESMSVERGVEKSRPPEIGVERQRRTEGPRERQPIEKGTERFRESSPGQKRVEKPRSQTDIL